MSKAKLALQRFRLDRSLLPLLFLFLVAVGTIVQFKTFRNAINPDGISYLDLAHYWSQGKIATAINPYWSPAYPLLLAVGVAILGRFTDEITILQIVNFLLLAFAFWTFARLVLLFEKIAGISKDKFKQICFRCVAITVFYLCFFSISKPFFSTPDLLFAAWFFLCCEKFYDLTKKPSQGSLLRLMLFLAVGCYIREVFFVWVPIFLGAVLWELRRQKKLNFKWFGQGIALYTVIVLPLVLAFSFKEGHLSFGCSARTNILTQINSAYVSSIANRELLNGKTTWVFLFPSDAPGTLPNLFDPCRWNAVSQDFRWLGNSATYTYIFSRNLSSLHSIALNKQHALLVVLLILSAIVYRRKKREGRSPLFWFYILSMTGFGIYFASVMEGRYIVAYAAIGLLCLLTQLPSKKILLQGLVGLAAVTTVFQIFQFYRVSKLYRQGSTFDYVGVAEKMKEKFQDKIKQVVVSGTVTEEMKWAHLYNAKIVGWFDENPYRWKDLKPSEFSYFAKQLKQRNVDAVVARFPSSAITKDWVTLNTNPTLYVYLLR